MGNTASGTSRERLVTASIAKYMTITKPQVMALRNAIVPLASKRGGSIKRNNLHFALQEANVADTPDKEVLDLLFTMWDMTGSGRVACVEFVIGLSVLACKEDAIETALRFALQVADKNRTGKISSKDASAFLRSTSPDLLFRGESRVGCTDSHTIVAPYFTGICATATYFGDRPLALRQIYKIVDTMFGNNSSTGVQEGEDLTHDQFVRLLTEQPCVQDVVRVKGKKKKSIHKQQTETSSPIAASSSSPVNPKSALDRLQEKFQQDENLDTVCSNSLLETSLAAGATEESDPDEKSQAVSSNYSTDFSSHMSSVQLTPLTKITISSNNPSPVQSQQPQLSLQTLQTMQPTIQKSNRQGLLIPWMKAKTVQA
jgi:Ca2+-binding EF-hand superfamily protein